MKIDLHNHTILCNHAEGSVDEYIEKAIEKEVDIFGFSDHAPMDFDPKYRMSFSQMHQYEHTILDAKKKYHDKIEILLAYEVDYLLSSTTNYVDKRVVDADVDYLIGSVHFVDKWGFDNPEFIGKYDEQDINTIWQKYFDAVEAMAQTNYFNIAGHLDLIKVFKFMPTQDIKTIAYSALKAIKKADMTLEVNGAGYRKPIAEAYPSKELLELAYELNIPISFGNDAHAPDQVALYSDNIHQLAKNIGYTECCFYRNRKRFVSDF